jgi:hypothetical protein
MSTLQEQDQDLTGPHSLRGEVALPRVSIDEYRITIVHEAIWNHSPLGSGWRLYEKRAEGVIFA